ncbi:putative Transmembrane efflux protein [metagenome]|uniref:Putative Transmembrane efflux protein n=1 Tax=metagenome TaxID=256318 RepID=A0A2P2CDY0_9ZZZZ
MEYAVPHPATARPLLMVSLGTALVLVTYVTPMATVPATAADLAAGPVARAWILSSMSVGLAAFLLATGVLGDSHGHRRTYLWGMTALGLGALGSAAATDAAVFVAARVVEGAGGAAILACGLAILADVFPAGAPRGQATAVWGASVGLGISVGCVLAAALDIGSGWRETYAVVGVAALLLIPATRRWVRLPVVTRGAPARRVDVAGLLLLSGAMTLLVTALTQGRSGVTALTLVLVTAAAVALALFAWTETRVAHPLLDPALLGEPRFVGATLGALVLGVGVIGTTSFVPTIVQRGLGGTLWTGSLLILVWSVTSVLTAVSLRRSPWPLTGTAPLAGLFVVVSLGLALAWGMRVDSSPWRLVPALLVSGLATGLLNALLGREAVASVPTDRTAMGSGANQTARYLGAACGITLFTVVATHAGGGEDPASLMVGWNAAVAVSAAVTLVGAVLLALVARAEISRRTSPVPEDAQLRTSRS